jgi:hypothetical protein
VLSANLPPETQRLHRPVCHGYQCQGGPSPGRQLRRPLECNELRVASCLPVRLALDRAKVWDPVQFVPVYLAQARSKLEESRLLGPSHIQSQSNSYSAESFPPPHADDHHRDLLYDMVAFPTRQAVQRFRRRADRYLGHVIRVRNRHVPVPGDRPIVLRLLLCAWTVSQCDRT